MKKLILLACLFSAIAFITPSASNAQIVSVTKPVAAKDTLTNADTTTISIAVDNISRSIEMWAIKRSGNTSTSIMILQGTINGTDYYAIDTLALANVTTVQKKKVNLRETNGDLAYKTYRAYCLSAGTCTWEPRVYHLRRSN